MLNRLQNFWRELSASQIIRGGFFAVIAIITIIAFFSIDSNDVKAPLFTLLGGFLLLVVVFPNRISNIGAIGLFTGTAVVVLGSWNWLRSSNEDDQYLWAIGLLAAAYVVTAVLYFPLILIVTRKSSKGRIDTNN